MTRRLARRLTRRRQRGPAAVMPAATARNVLPARCAQMCSPALVFRPPMSCRSERRSQRWGPAQANRPEEQRLRSTRQAPRRPGALRWASRQPASRQPASRRPALRQPASRRRRYRCAASGRQLSLEQLPEGEPCRSGHQRTLQRQALKPLQLLQRRQLSERARRSTCQPARRRPVGQRPSSPFSASRQIRRLPPSSPPPASWRAPSCRA